MITLHEIKIIPYYFANTIWKFVPSKNLGDHVGYNSV